MLKFVLKGYKLKTGNELKRMHNSPSGKGWALYAAYKKQLARVLEGGFKDKHVKLIAQCRVAPQVKRRAVIRVFVRRLQDEDNFIASLKPLLDVMVNMNLLRDDSPKWLDLVAIQEVDKDRAYQVTVGVN